MGLNSECHAMRKVPLFFRFIVVSWVLTIGYSSGYENDVRRLSKIYPFDSIRVKRNVVDSCIAYDKDDNKYDLTELRGQDFSVVYNNTEVYLFRVCETLPFENSPCGNSSICLQNTSYGRYSNSTSLKFIDGKLILNYTEGDPCPKEYNTSLSTLITFTCDSNTKPTASLNTCELTINYPTSLACRNQIDCRVEELDLAVFENKQRNYEITTDKGTISLNICRRLVTGSSKCPFHSSDSFVCFTPFDSASSSFSLGSVGTKPVKDIEGYEIQYHENHQESPCDENSKISYSSSIHFMCDYKSGKGSPVFHNITDDCQYQFHWKTDRVCPSNPLTFYNDQGRCSLFNQKTKNHLDLTSFFINHPTKLETDGTDYWINFCRQIPVSKCGSLLCGRKGDDLISFGQLSTLDVHFDYNKKEAVFKLSSGGHCLSGRDSQYSSEIHLSCSEDPNEDRWTVSEAGCHVVLRWNSPSFCFDSNKSSASGGRVLPAVLMILVILVLVSLLAFLVWRKRHLANVNKIRRDVQYMRVGESEEVTLLSQGLSEEDSDDDLIHP